MYVLRGVLLAMNGLSVDCSAHAVSVVNSAKLFSAIPYVI